MFTLTTRTDITSGFIAGEDREFSFTFIMVEFDNGARYALRDSDICSMYENQYGFVQSRDQAEIDATQARRIAKMNAAIAGGKRLDLAECWYEIEPAYGSEAYINRPSLTEILQKVYGK